MHNEFDWRVAGTIGHDSFSLPMDLMSDEERGDYLDARFEAARDYAPYDDVRKVPASAIEFDCMVNTGWVSECCDVPYAGVESPQCPKCHDNTGYYRAWCPTCGQTLEHFGGLDAMPEGVVCPDCNDAIYDMTDGQVIAELV